MKKSEFYAKLEDRLAYNYVINAVTKILVIPKATALEAEISGATAPTKIPGRKKRA